jgi:hypothetical protein
LGNLIQFCKMVVLSIPMQYISHFLRNLTSLGKVYIKKNKKKVTLLREYLVMYTVQLNFCLMVLSFRFSGLMFRFIARYRNLKWGFNC